MEGAYKSMHKDGSVYYRSSINYKNVHVSLGSFPTERQAHQAYLEAKSLYEDVDITLENYKKHAKMLALEKIITILNHRDHGMYLKTPIYLQKGYFLYYLSDGTQLKFDADDLFYYSSHRILRRQGSLYVNDYGSQYRVLSRYGVRNFAVPGRDFIFVNGDHTDYRSANILVLSHYHGVLRVPDTIPEQYEVKIHLNGDFRIGYFQEEATAAIAYNKAADYAKHHGILKDFPQNYVDSISPSEYATIYTDIELPKKYRKAVKNLVKP